MSLSNPTLTNPARQFFQWGGSVGQLAFYDKENKKNVPIKLPFEFIVLDELATIGGFNKSDQSGFWSNEVRNISNDELFVRTKKGPFEAGLYANLTQTRAKGGKYTKSIYIAFKVKDQWVIGNFKAGGSALSAWIEFGKAYNVQSGKIIMERGEQMDAPTGVYFPPTFAWVKWNDEEYNAALALDRELQVYLSNYLAAPKVDDDARGLAGFNEPGTTNTATPEQQADFEQRKQQNGLGAAPAHERNDVIEDFNDEPINLDDIPF